MPLSVEDTRIEGVLGAGILSATRTTIHRTLVAGVSPSEISAVTFPPDGALVGPVADGILLYGGGTAELEDVWVEDAERAGILLAAGDHALTRVRVLGGEVGLAPRDGATSANTDVDFSLFTTNRASVIRRHEGWEWANPGRGIG